MSFDALTEALSGLTSAYVQPTPNIITLTLNSELGKEDPVLFVIEHALTTSSEPSSSKPQHKLELRVTSRNKSLSAHQQAKLTDCCSSILSRESDDNSNPLFNCAMQLRDCVQDLAGELDAATSHVQEQQTDRPLQRTVRVKRVLLWSHHLLAISKRKDIVSWSSELSLAGLSKPGCVPPFSRHGLWAMSKSLSHVHSYPGVIVIEGEESDSDEFVRRIKALQWQALQVRCEETEEVQRQEGQENGNAVRKSMRLHLESDGSKPVVHEVESLAQVSSR